MCTGSPSSASQEYSNDSSGESNSGSGSQVPAMSLSATPTEVEDILLEYGPNLKILECNHQVAELLTIIRDKNTSRSDFKFYADRLIRLVIEESLNQLPYSDCSVETPTGAIYEGLKYRSGNCGVSIIRSGEAMEQGLRDCCRSIRIGKILVESDADTHVARVVYARFPDDIARRQVLLMYPIMSTGNTVLQAVNVLKDHGVPENCIILSNLFSTPIAAKTVVGAFPKLKILTSELHPVAPNHFGQKYFASARNCPKLETERQHQYFRKRTTNTSLSILDEEFVHKVGCDIEQYLKERHKNGVLLFPPVNNFRRFLIHQTCENFQQQYDLFTFSVGQGLFRRTVVCFKNQLLEPNKYTDAAAAVNIGTRKQSPIKSWRSERKTEPGDFSSPPIHVTTPHKNLGPKMGAEKNTHETRLNKTHSVDLYRPPALRNRSFETVDLNPAPPGAGASASNASTSTTTTKSISTLSYSATTNTTSMSCNNSPVHANGNGKVEHFERNTTNMTGLSQDPTSMPAPAPAAAVTALPGKQERQQQTIRRERRPDRAVYIPRARRSQTTPPTTTQSQATTATTTTTAAASSTATMATTSNNASGCYQKLPIATETTALVSTALLSKTDEVGRSVSGGKQKVRSAGNKERKERTKKSANAAQGNKTLNVSDKSETTVILIAQSDIPKNSEVSNRNYCDSVQQKTADSSSINTVDSLEKLKLTIPEQTSAHIIGTNIMNTSNINGNDNSKSSGTGNNNSNSNGFAYSARNVDRRSKVNANEVLLPLSNIRIEDIALNHNARNTQKCDIDAEEFKRASKEINRSNRRIIKQSFVSDVLEIPEKINEDTPSAPTMRSGVNRTAEGEEDDWENMYDDSGECLDPKIIDELTASVGKVKIEMPKMDYGVYLTKQSILNDEEFPHVLEVSNFPVEFRNQDFLMVFSQYKESGFDIKWVDDTHALAVFSSSRIAAEVLTMGHPFVVLKPLAEATVESRLKAKKCSASLQPYRPRPETCAALARRLVTGALGVRLKTAAAERENEKRVLRAAKERKLLAAKQRDEAWDS